MVVTELFTRILNLSSNLQSISQCILDTKGIKDWSKNVDLSASRLIQNVRRTVVRLKIYCNLTFFFVSVPSTIR